MIILSVDYGDARTGIAVCDKMQILASPVTVIHESYEPKVIAKIKEIISEKKPELIVVGLPVNLMYKALKNELGIDLNSLKG